MHYFMMNGLEKLLRRNAQRLVKPKANKKLTVARDNSLTPAQQAAMGFDTSRKRAPFLENGLG